jgi:RNA polymerase sigma-70 factor (ECF subfamily)
VTTSGSASALPDREALGAAFDAHAQEVFRFCARRCHDWDLAEDLMSVVFLEAWRSRDRAVLVDGSLRPWLYGIATNVLRNSTRSTRRHHAALDRYRRLDPPQPVQDHADTVAVRADADRDRAAVDLAFAALSRKDRDVAELCLREGLSPAAAAAALGLPAGTVKSRLAHAREHLQRVLRSSEPDGQTDPRQLSGHEQDERPLGAPAGSATT